MGESALIVALNSAGGISADGRIPWTLPNDLRHFRRTTIRAPPGRTNAVVMGRKTWETLRAPLADRYNIVLSRTMAPSAGLPRPSVLHAVPSWEAWHALRDRLPALHATFVMGGLEVYEEALRRRLVTHMHVTQVCDSSACDRTLSIDHDRWTSIGAPVVEREGGLAYRICEFVPTSQHSWARTGGCQTGEHAVLELYRELVRAPVRRTRNGATRAVFGRMLSFDLRRGFPLLTTKRVFFRGVIEELLWFVRGETHTRALADRGVRIWDANASAETLASLGLPYAEGECGPIYGWQWRRFGARYPHAAGGVDQLREVVRLLRTDPLSRRIVMSAWNPTDLGAMCLPPCHVLYQFHVDASGALSCMMTQRSADAFLGLPFNMASTAALTTLLAAAAGMPAGSVTLALGDVHVYETHLEAMETQLSRRPRLSPMVELDWSPPPASADAASVVRSMEALTADRFRLHFYAPMGKLAAPMST